MARRRFQKPEPKKHGNCWTIVLWEDYSQDGKAKRRQKRVRLAPLKTMWRTVLRLRDEYLNPLNDSLVAFGSATNFEKFVEETYIPQEMPLLATTTQNRYQGVLKNYLLPRFGKFCLRDLTPVVLQRYFSSMANWTLSGESRDKIRDVLATVLKKAVRKYGLLDNNPMEVIELPPNRSGHRKKKPYLTPEQFDELVNAMSEPYATMVYVAIYTGLRISELLGLKWNDLGYDSIMIDECFCRGDWSEPKSSASNATIAVDRHVIERIHHLKLLTVRVRAGRATRNYKVGGARSSKPAGWPTSE